MLEANRQTAAVRSEAKAALLAADPRAKTKDSDYVFITFILAKLPHGLIGLLIAVIFAAALNSLGRRAQRAEHDDDDRLLAVFPSARRRRRSA